MSSFVLFLSLRANVSIRMPLAFLTFLAILSLNYADNPCRFEHSKGVIDLTSIASTTGPRFKDVSPGPSSNYSKKIFLSFQFFSESSYSEYSYNPCKSFDEGSMCINVAACQGEHIFCSWKINRR